MAPSLLSSRNLLAFLALAAGPVVGCQSYNVDPVEPKAVRVADKTLPIVGRKLPPNVMLVVDRSGSMTASARGSGGGCARNDGTYTENAADDCKWNDLRKAVAGDGTATNPGFVNLLDQTLSAQTADGEKVSLGLTLFSASDLSGNICQTGQVAIPLSNGTARVTAIVQRINQQKPSGATPTAATMKLLGNTGIFPEPEANKPRDNYAVLLTDGAPNCSSDAALANNAKCSGERCTFNTTPNACATYSANTCVCSNTAVSPPPPAGCLDQDGLVAAIKELNEQKAIKTFVIGFGADTAAGATAETLNAAAKAGGFPRLNAAGQPEATSYYQAGSLAELKAALDAIIGNLNQVCRYELDAAPPNNDENLVQVIATTPKAGRRQLTPQQFEINGKQLTITDRSLCSEINTATLDQKVELEFRYIAN